MYPELAYPLRKEIIPIWLAAFLAAVVPILVILAAQIRVRSFWDVNNGVLGLLYSLITAAVFQVWIKWLIGGLRPHFLAVCQPDVSLAATSRSQYDAAGFRQLYYTREICTGDRREINDSLESFPSGHSTAAFAGFVYLFLYLNAKLKVFANYHAAMWKLVAVYAPLLAAVLIAGALTIDEFHHWWDLLAGALIGSAMAFSAYRMCYAAVWDWRFNHIPMHRGQPFAYAGAGAGIDLEDAVWTHRAGWGVASSVAAHHHGGGHHRGAPGGAMAGAGAGGMTQSRKPVGGGVPARGDDIV